MFEQIETAAHRTKSLAMLTSATVQAAIVATAVLLSMIQIQVLGPLPLLHAPPLVPPSIKRDAVELVSSERVSLVRMAVAVAKPLVAPSRIPQRAMQIVDLPDLSGGGVAAWHVGNADDRAISKDHLLRFTRTTPMMTQSGRLSGTFGNGPLRQIHILDH